MTRNEAITRYIESTHSDIPMPVKLDSDFLKSVSETVGFNLFFLKSVLDNFICKLLKRISC